MKAGCLSVLSFAWFYIISGSSVWEKHSKNGTCSCSLGLPTSISRRRLSNVLFVFSSLDLIPLLFSGANLAFKRIANKDAGDRGQVFICVIRLLYRTPESSVPRRLAKNDACSYFLLWPPSTSQTCMWL